MHNIEFNEQTQSYSVMVAKKAAWHELGVLSTEYFTAEQAIKGANLGFEVEKHPIYTSIPAPDGFGIIQQQIPNKFATVRMDNGVPLGVVGNQYTVLQNREAFGFFDAIVEEGDALYETVGLLGKGETLWIMAKLPDYIHIKGNDPIAQYVVLTNSHDGNSAVQAFTTHVRVVCNNTLTMALRGTKNKVSVRHTASMVQNLATAHEILGISNEIRENMKQIYERLAEKQINGRFVDKVLNMLFPDPEDEKMRNMSKPKREAILEALETAPGQDIRETRGTAYWLYNGITYWGDHGRDYKNPSKRLESTWTGYAADLRTKAGELILSQIN